MATTNPNTAYEVLKAAYSAGTLTTIEPTTDYEVLKAVHNPTHEALNVNVLNIGTGSTVAAGADTTVQFNNAGVISGSTALTFDGSQITNMPTIDDDIIATGAITVGSRLGATGAKSSVFGNDNTASGDYSTASGYQSTASGNYSTASGYYAEASGNYSMAIGDGTTASGEYSFAFGNSANAVHNYSIVLGESITSVAANTTYVNKLETVDVGEGVIMASPDGTRYKLTIANGGTVDVTAV